VDVYDSRPTNQLKLKILQVLHAAPTAGTPCRDETLYSSFPGNTGARNGGPDNRTMSQDARYANRTKISLIAKYSPVPHSKPQKGTSFSQIALDLITGLHQRTARLSTDNVDHGWFTSSPLPPVQHNSWPWRAQAIL